HYRSAPNEYDDGAGDNPPEGALITYYLAEAPEDEITLDVLDADGQVIRTLSSEKEDPYTAANHPDWDPDTTLEADLEAVAGLNRAAWNLAHKGAERIEDARSDVGDPGDGPKVAPRRYTMRLNVAGRSYEQPLEVQADPRAPVDAAALESQIAFTLEIRDRMSEIAGLVAGIRSLRGQIEAHNGWLLYGSLEHDGPPTQGMREVRAELDGVLTMQKAALEDVGRNDVARLNSMAGDLAVPYILER
ncbi:MAG TPA: hypothetical protein VM616_03460, partial [Gammaproteobacteria bacterium]|nr:hypothetical protein [Gammaproteobacteria bacterium]